MAHSSSLACAASSWPSTQSFGKPFSPRLVDRNCKLTTSREKKVSPKPKAFPSNPSFCFSKETSSKEQHTIRFHDIQEQKGSRTRPTCQMTRVTRAILPFTSRGPRIFDWLFPTFSWALQNRTICCDDGFMNLFPSLFFTLDRLMMGVCICWTGFGVSGDWNVGCIGWTWVDGRNFIDWLDLRTWINMCWTRKMMEVPHPIQNNPMISWPDVHAQLPIFRDVSAWDFDLHDRYKQGHPCLEPRSTIKLSSHLLDQTDKSWPNEQTCTVKENCKMAQETCMDGQISHSFSKRKNKTKSHPGRGGKGGSRKIYSIFANATKKKTSKTFIQTTMSGSRIVSSCVGKRAKNDCAKKKIRQRRLFSLPEQNGWFKKRGKNSTDSTFAISLNLVTRKHKEKNNWA